MDTQRFNIPDKDDPEWSDKVINLIRQLFESQENPLKSLTPITTPEETQQVGTFFFDSTTGKIKVVTEEGTKTLQFEP